MKTFKYTSNISISNVANRYDLHEYVFIKLRGETSYEFIDKRSVKDIIDRETEVNNISLTETFIFQDTRKELESATGEAINFLYEVDTAVPEKGKTFAYLTVGKVEKVEKKQTKTKKDYKRISLRDDTKTLNGVFVWPWKCKNGDTLRKGDLIAAKIEVDENGFKNLIRFTKVNEDED